MKLRRNLDFLKFSRWTRIKSMRFWGFTHKNYHIGVVRTELPKLRGMSATMVVVDDHNALMCVDGSHEECFEKQLESLKQREG